MRGTSQWSCSSPGLGTFEFAIGKYRRRDSCTGPGANFNGTAPQRKRISDWWCPLAFGRKFLPRSWLFLPVGRDWAPRPCSANCRYLLLVPRFRSKCPKSAEWPVSVRFRRFWWFSRDHRSKCGRRYAPTHSLQCARRGWIATFKIIKIQVIC